MKKWLAILMAMMCRRLKVGPEVGRKTVVASVAFALVVTTFPIAAFLTAQPAKAAWYNDDWHYRKSILFTHSGSETNVYLNLSGTNALDTSASGKFQSDCGDLRFTDSTGKILPYYLVSGCGTATTVVHVLYASMPQGDQYLYVYYGNPTVANGTTGFDFATAATGITFGSVGSEETSQGPVAEWKFDEGYGTTAHDSTTNGMSGVINGPTWQSADMCVSGKCLSYGSTGTNNVNLGTSSVLTPSIFTVSAWVKYQDPTYYYNYIYSNTRDIGTNNGIDLYIYAGVPRCQIWNGSGATAGPSTVLPTNQWMHLACTYNGSLLTMYINGKPVGANATALGVGSPASYTTAIGAMGYGPGTYGFKGSIDQVQLFDYARTQQQIQQSYVAGVQQMNQQRGNLGNGLVGYWKMDEASWNGTSGEVKDSSGAGSNGTAVSGATVATGKFGNGGSFNGTSYATIPSASATESVTGGDATFSFWLNQQTRDGTNAEVFLEKFPSSNAGGWAMRLGTNGQLYARLSYSGVFKDVIAGTDYLSTNNWYFVSLVVNRKKNAAQWYINGQPSGTATDITGLGTLTTASPPNIDIGAGAQAFGLTKWQGFMDDVRLYNRALSAPEVSQLYNFGPSPVAAYNFEEGSGTAVNDVSGNGNTAAWNGTATHWAPSVSGTAGDFNGQDNFVRASDSASLDTVSSLSAGAWIKTNEQRAGNYIVQKIDGFSLNGWLLALDSGGHIYARVGNASTYSSLLTTTVVPTGTWHYISMTLVAPSSLNIYYDGTLVGSLNPGLTPTSTTRQLTIGTTNWRGSGTNYDFNGKIDNVTVYNYARSQTQILQDMNTGASPLNSPVGWWKMDEGQGTVAHNSGIGGSALDGTLTNMASPATATSGWTGAGRYGGALNFDSTDDYVNAGTSSLLDITTTSTVTMSTWIYPTSSTAIDRIQQKGNPYSASGKGYSLLYRGDLAGKPLNFQFNDGSVAPCSISSTGLGDISSKWSYATIVVDRISGKVAFYINGINVTNSNTATINSCSGSWAVGATLPNFTIGQQAVGTGGFGGTIDEFKYYNTTLSQQDILADYNRAVTVKSGSVSTQNVQTQSGATSTQPSNSKSSEYCVPGDTSSCNGPVGEWKFEEGSGTSVADSSGNGNAGTWNGTGSHWSSGKIGKAGNFDGTDDYVAVNSSSSLNPTAVTIEGWVKFKAVDGAYHTIAGKWQPGVNQQYLLQVDTNNKLAFWSGDGGTGGSVIESTTTPTVGKWYHVVGTQTGTTKNLYVNGILEASTSSGIALGTSSVPFSIGSKKNSSGTYFEYINGSIDQVKVFNYARTPAQVAWDYNKGGPVAQYKMDECSGTTIHDASGNGLDGVLNLGASGVTTAGTCLTSGTAWGNGASGKINSSMSFDYTDDYISVASYSSLSPGTNDFSIGLWFKTTLPGDLIATSNSSLANSTLGYGLVVASPSFGCVGRPLYFNMIVSGVKDSGICGVKQVGDGNWHHVTISVQRGQYMRMFVDGKLDASSTTSLSGTVTNNQFSIGRVWWTHAFSGQIDDVQIFNYALTPVQIASLYNGGSVRWGP